MAERDDSTDSLELQTEEQTQAPVFNRSALVICDKACCACESSICQACSACQQKQPLVLASQL